MDLEKTQAVEALDQMEEVVGVDSAVVEELTGEDLVLEEAVGVEEEDSEGATGEDSAVVGVLETRLKETIMVEVLGEDPREDLAPKKREVLEEGALVRMTESLQDLVVVSIFILMYTFVKMIVEKSSVFNSEYGIH